MTHIRRLGITLILSCIHTLHNLRCLIMIKWSCLVTIQISFLRFQIKLLRLHLFCYFLKIISSKFLNNFTFVYLVVFFNFFVGAFEWILDFSHAHGQMWLLQVVLLITYNLSFSVELLSSVSWEAVFRSVDLIDIGVMMLFQNTSWMFEAPLHLVALSFLSSIQLLLDSRQPQLILLFLRSCLIKNFLFLTENKTGFSVWSYLAVTLVFGNEIANCWVVTAFAEEWICWATMHRIISPPLLINE